MEWKKLIDKALGTDFNTPAYDKEAGRKKLIRQIDLAAKQHSEGITRAPNRSWKSGGTEADPSVRFSAKVDGKAVLLDGDEAVYVPASRFQDFLKHLKSSVQAGDLDKEIKAALGGDGSAVGNGATGSGSSSTNNSGAKRTVDPATKEKQRIGALARYGKNADGSPMSDEQKAAYKASRAGK